MSLARALELNSQICRFLVAHEMGEPVAPLPTEVTLAEWLQATGLVRAENERLSALPLEPGQSRKTYVLVDARGVAAAYVLTHYQGDPLPHPEVILVAAGKALLLATVKQKCPRSPDGRHTYGATSPMDTVETCIHCDHERPCPALADDARFKGATPPPDAT